MKKLCLITAVVICFYYNSYAQTDVENKIDAAVKSLKEQGVNTIISFHPYCVGCITTWSDTSKSACHSADLQYLIWTKDNQNFIQLFDQCYEYQPLIGVVTHFIAIYDEHLQEILKEEIKPVAYNILVDGKEQIFESSIDHDFHHDFLFYLETGKVAKPMQDYYLNNRFEGDFSNRPNTASKPINVNYQYNQKTYLKKLLDELDKDLKYARFMKS